MPYYVADGSERMVDVTIQPVQDEDGRLLALSLTGTDITDRKRAEAQRRQLEQELRSLAAELSEANRRKNEFLAILSHELRNPLAPISNAVRALRSGRNHGTIQSASAILERQVGQIVRLVDDLLDMSRITRGKLELRKEHTELAPIVNQAVETVRALYKNTHRELTVTLPSEPVYLDADPARLVQVISNLLNNAFKFTDKTGRVGLTVETEGTHVAIRVRDDGIGIAAKQFPRLFEMFTQVDTLLERSRDGLGIGLTLVKTLTEMHGGTVEVHSDGLGRGSEFTVRLPSSEELLKPSSPPMVTEPVPMGGRRVLVVDDNEDHTESLAMLLELEGYETLQAHDGVEAIDAAEGCRPDAVLLDVGLPKMNGYEVCRHIREQPWGKHVVLVALTGWGQEEDRRRSEEAGFDTHMVKPPDQETLIKTLAALLSGRNANRQTAHRG
jgi:signal transduction histidine kinase/ActR/RegA family two-component response regulator